MLAEALREFTDAAFFARQFEKPQGVTDTILDRNCADAGNHRIQATTHYQRIFQVERCQDVAGVILGRRDAIEHFRSHEGDHVPWLHEWHSAGSLPEIFSKSGRTTW